LACPRTSSRSIFTATGKHIAKSSSQYPKCRFTFENVRFFSGAGDHIEIVPGLGDSITEATVVNWVKGVGEYVDVDETFLVLETDKVSVDIRASKGGVLLEQKAAEDDTVEVGQEIAVFDTAAAKPEGAAATPAPEAAAAKAPPPPPPPTSAATPAATPAAAKAAPAAAPEAAAAPAAFSRVEKAVPLSRMRLTIAKRLKDSQNTACMLTTFNEIDMTAIMALRSKHKDEFLERHGVKLGFMSMFTKASSNALMKYPAVNGLFDGDNKQTIYRDYADISIAVATPTGLVVPVLRNVESMNFAGVEGAIAEYGKKARAGKIALEDMAGGTFTISNGGVYGSLMGTPLLNGGQSAVLGMHGIFKRPVVIDNEVKIRPMMYVALTYDHRIIDGSDAVVFLKDIKNSVEDPSRLLLDL
jgi:2-oxoglutarate dehydrogenase E2 component (dihydrolipoamide succinyltransferase)